MNADVLYTSVKNSKSLYIYILLCCAMMAMLVYLLPCSMACITPQPSNLRWDPNTSLPILLSSRPNARDHHTWTNVRCTWALKNVASKLSASWNRKMMIGRQAFLLRLPAFSGYAKLPRSTRENGFCLNLIKRWGKRKKGSKNWKAIRPFQAEDESDSTCALRNKCCWETLGK